MSRGAVSVDREPAHGVLGHLVASMRRRSSVSSDSSKPTSNARMVGLTCVADIGSACHVVDVAGAGAKKSISSWLTRSASSWWTQCEASGRRSTRSRLGTSSSWGSASLDVVLHLLGRDVVLDEAVVAPGAGEVEVLAVVQLADAADDGADGVRALHGAVEHRPLQGDVAGQLVHPRRVVVREPAGGIAPSEVGRNAVGRLGPGDVGHGVRVVYGGARRARDRPGRGPWRIRAWTPAPPDGPGQERRRDANRVGAELPHWSADICGYARFAVVDTPVKAATNSPRAAAACWRSHVAIAGLDEDGSRPMAGLEDLDVRGVVDARQRGPVRARRVVRSGRPAWGVPSRSARPGWAQQDGRTPGTAPHAGRRASGSAPSARVRRRPGAGSRSQSA